MGFVCLHGAQKKMPRLSRLQAHLFNGLLDFHCDFSYSLAAQHQTIVEKAEKPPAAHARNGILREGADSACSNLFTSISIYQRVIKKLK